MQVTQPEPKTRQEALWQARARKAKNLSPPKASWLQRQLANLENEQTLEDAFEVPSPSAGGFYFTLGRIKTGAGLTLGSGYDSKSGLSDQVFLSVGAAGSVRKCWSAEAEVALPRLADGKAFASGYTRKNYFPRENVFGTGPQSREDDRVSCLYRDTVFGATVGVNVVRWLSVGGDLEYIAPLVSGGHDGRFPSSEKEFTEEKTPGLTAQPDFVRTETFADIDYTSPRVNPMVNGLDILEGPEGQQYIKHYMFDFGSIMGSGGLGFARQPRGRNEYVLDWKRGFATLASFGLYVRPWLKVDHPEVSPAVGRFEGESFTPEIWRPEYPNPAFRNLRPDDAYWAARIVGQFSDEAIRAVVETTEYADRRVTDYIAATLIKRRDKLVEHWLNQANPVESFQLDPSVMLTFENTAVKLGVATPTTNYVLTWYRFDNAIGEHDLVVEEEWIEEPRAQAPDALLTVQDFVAVVIRGVHPALPMWLRSARMHFRKTAEGWETVGIERGYDERVPQTRPR